MTATRVIDDHIELANIGTKTHAETESHIQGIGNYAFPATDGNPSQVLETDGNGILSWNSVGVWSCAQLVGCNLSDIGARSHSQLTGIGASDHHAKYLDSEAIIAMGAKGDSNPLHHDKLITDAVHVQNYMTGTVNVASGVVFEIDFDNDLPPFQHAVIEYDYGGMYAVKLNKNKLKLIAREA